MEREIYYRMYEKDPETGALISIDTGEVINERGKLQSATGRELPDPTPIAPPVGYKKQPSIHEQMRAMMRAEHARMEELRAGHETFEESEDFDIGEDYDPTSPYEIHFDPEDIVASMSQSPEPAPEPQTASEPASSEPEPEK